MNQPDPAEIEALPNPPITRLPDSVRAVFRAAPSSAVVDTLLNHADALLAALATAEERRDQAEFQAKKWFAAFTETQESVVTLSRELLAAAKIENAQPGATGEGS